MNWLRACCSQARASRQGLALVLLGSVLLVPLLVGAGGLSRAEKIERKAGVHVVLEGQAWTDTALMGVEGALDRLPRHIRQSIRGVYVLYNSRGRTLNGDTPYGTGNPPSFYYNNRDRDEIVLRTSSSGTPWDVALDVKVRTLHELGHVYLSRCGIPPGRYARVLLQPEMEAFMKATGWTLESSREEVLAVGPEDAWTEIRFRYHGRRIPFPTPNPVEDYAHSFQQYFLWPDYLRKVSPERYAFMRDHVADSPFTCRS